MTGLCACGCGAEVRGAWKQGHNPKMQGRTFTGAHRRKLSESNKATIARKGHPCEGRVVAESTRRKIGDKHRGKTLSSSVRLKISATKLASGVSEEPDAIHRWLNRWYPKSGVCEECGASGKTDYASLTEHVYTRDRSDYAELCASCHLKLDYSTGCRVVPTR